MLDAYKFNDKKIIAFAGIGNPSNFFELLEENKLNLINKFSFPDHYKFSKKELDTLILDSNNQNAVLLTTEKDYYRIDDNYKKKIQFAKVKLEIENREDFIKFLEKNI